MGKVKKNSFIYYKHQSETSKLAIVIIVVVFVVFVATNTSQTTYTRTSQLPPLFIIIITNATNGSNNRQYITDHPVSLSFMCKTVFISCWHICHVFSVIRHCKAPVPVRTEGEIYPDGTGSCMHT